MPTITYTFDHVCAGGGHVEFDIAINGGATQPETYHFEELTAPLSSLTDEQRRILKLMILKVHFAGFTQQQVINAFQAGGGSVTVTI